MLAAFSELKTLHLADNPISQRSDDKLRVFLLHTFHHVHCFDVRVHRDPSCVSSPTKFTNKHSPPDYIHPPQFYDRQELVDAAKVQSSFHWHHYLDHLAGVVMEQGINRSDGQVNKVTAKPVSSAQSGGAAASSVLTPTTGYLRPLEKTNKNYPELNTRTQHSECVAQAKKVATKKGMKEISDPPKERFVSPRKFVRSQKLNDGSDRILDTPVRAIMSSLASEAAPTSLRSTSLIKRASKHLSNLREEGGAEGRRISDGSGRQNFKGSMGTLTSAYPTAHERASDALLNRGFRRRNGSDEENHTVDPVFVPDNLDQPTSPVRKKQSRQIKI